jgi:hypothetical protein
MLDWLKKIFGIDKLDYRIRLLERARYWREKYGRSKKRDG